MFLESGRDFCQFESGRWSRGEWYLAINKHRIETAYHTRYHNIDGFNRKAAELSREVDQVSGCRTRPLTTFPVRVFPGGV